jgi:hypothetical protein
VLRQHSRADHRVRGVRDRCVTRFVRVEHQRLSEWNGRAVDQTR